LVENSIVASPTLNSKRCKIRALRVVRATEHPDTVLSRDVNHSRRDRVARATHANVHHRALHRVGEHLEVVDSLKDPRDLTRTLVVAGELRSPRRRSALSAEAA
jgi:hypothetical protein